MIEGYLWFYLDSYNEAKVNFKEAKRHLVEASNHYKEACDISNQSKQDLTCPEFQDIDECILPGLEIMILLTDLEASKSIECGEFGCSDKIKRDCADMQAQAAVISTKCDSPDSSQFPLEAINEVCQDLSEK